MADYILDLVLVLLKELSGAGEGNLVDVSVYLLLRHTDTVIDNFKGFGLLIQFNVNLEVSKFLLAVS